MEVQDRVSIICCFATGIFLLCIPILMSYKLYQIRDLLDDDEILEEYEYLLSNLRTKSIGQAIYNIMFCLRRVLIIVSLYLIPQDKVSLQLVLNLVVQQIYLMYICMFSPLEKKQDRVMEKINEYLTLIVIYFYMLMCDSAYDSGHRSNIGFFHVFITIFMLILNLLLILRNFGFDTLPDLYGK